MRVFLSGWTIPENSKYLISSTDLHIIRCTITLINSCQHLSLTTKGKKLLVRVFDLSAEYFNSRTDIRAYLRAKWGLLCFIYPSDICRNAQRLKTGEYLPIFAGAFSNVTLLDQSCTSENI